jgi:dihydroorotate dehydrogenase electron transfer subunit
MRPFSLNSVDTAAGTLEILYKIVGTGTETLSTLPEGAEADVLGPLGSPFPLSENMERIAVIGRGVGAAPMRFLAEQARSFGIDVHAYISANREEHLFDKDAYLAAGCSFTGCTDGNINVTSFFADDLKTMKFDAAYVCGSKRLMRDVSMLMDQYGFEGYVSLEAHMACGIGACKGCVVSIKMQDGSESYARVCKEGPVFPVKRIV